MTYEEIERELEKAVSTYHPKKMPWNSREDTILQKYYNRVPIADLAKQLGRTMRSIRAHAVELKNRGVQFEHAKNNTPPS